jgi:hypothetical protein
MAAWSTWRKVANLPAGNARGLKESPILFARIERIGRCTDCDVGHQGTLIAPSIKTIRPDPNGHIEIKPDRQAGITRMLAAVTELVIGEPLHELLHGHHMRMAEGTLVRGFDPGQRCLFAYAVHNPSLQVATVWEPKARPIGSLSACSG